METHPFDGDSALLALAQSDETKEAKEAFETLFARYADEVRQRIRRNVAPEQEAEALEQWVKEDTRKKIKHCDSAERSFQNLVSSRCALALLRHFSEPSHRDAVRLEKLIEQLNSCPGFPSKRSPNELSLVLDGLHRPEAFGELWAVHSKALFGFIRIRARKDDDAADILQETALQLFESGITDFDPTLAQFRHFAKAYAQNRLKRHFTSQHRRSETSLNGSSNTGGGPTDTPPKEPVDPSRGPDVIAEELELIHRALRVAFSLKSPLHQLIVFGFHQLLEFEPQQIVLELSPFVLFELAARLQIGYAAKSAFPESEVVGFFEDLRTRLPLGFRVVVKHPKTRKLYPALRERIMGSIALEEFYPEERNHERNDVVAQWSAHVLRRLQTRILPPAPGSARTGDSVGSKAKKTERQEADNA
jgi:DNA-directed RNA polymerase specialized sigma24 family protein